MTFFIKLNNSDNQIFIKKVNGSEVEGKKRLRLRSA